MLDELSNNIQKTLSKTIIRNVRITHLQKEGVNKQSRAKMELENFYFKMALKTEPILDDTTLRDGIHMPGLAVGPKDAAKLAWRE